MSATLVRFPLQGMCVAKRPPRHHPLALDLMGLTEPGGHTSAAGFPRWLLGAASASRYHGWGRRVYGPGRGEVVTASDGLEDRSSTGLLNTVALWTYASFLHRPTDTEAGEPDIRSNVGNHVMVRMHTGCVAFYAHLQNGSVGVKVGDPVEDGTVLGFVGNSGNTTAPHLHVHVMDQAHDLRKAELQPFVFDTYERWDGSGWIAESRTLPEPGEVVRSVDSDASELSSGH